MSPPDPPARASGDDDDIDIEVGLGLEDFDESSFDDPGEDEDGLEFSVEDDEEEEESSLRVVNELQEDLRTMDMPALATGTHGAIEVPDESSKHMRIAAFFQAMDKLLRGIRLYEGRGLLVDKLAGRMQSRADAMVADGDVLVRVAPFGVLYEGGNINPAEDKPAKYLFRLFCDGVRELTFLRGVDGAELRAFAEVLATDAKSAEEDLITLLWKKELKTIRYYATDTLQAGEDTQASDDHVLAGAAKSRLQGQDEGEQLIMSADDLRMLDADDALLWVRESRSPNTPAAALKGTTIAIKGSFSRGGDYERFVSMALRATTGETASPLVVGLYDGLVSGGEAEGVAGLLVAATAGAKRSGAGRALRDVMLDPKRLPSLAALMDRKGGDLLSAVEGVTEGRQEVLVALLNLLKTVEIRDQLRERLTSDGVDLTAYYSERLKSEDPAMVIEAVESLGKIGGSEAARAIIPALGATATAVRRAGLDAMVGSYHPEARIYLGRALRDPDADNRMLALSILRDSGDPRAAGQILTTVQAMIFNGREPAEKDAFYEALAAFKDGRTLEFFESILGQKNLTRSKAVAAQQMTAVRALSAMHTPESREALDRAARRWFLPGPVREAAQRAVKAAPRA